MNRKYRLKITAEDDIIPDVALHCTGLLDRSDDDRMRYIAAACLLILVSVVPNGAQNRSREEIRDPQERLVGTIICQDRRCEARDPAGRLRGSYLVAQNETRDPQGRLIARGNILPALFYCSSPPKP